MESVSPNRVWTCLLWNNKNNFLIKQDLGSMEQEMRVYIKLRTQTSSTHHLHWCSKSHIGLMGNKRRVRQNGVIHSPKSNAPWTECWGSRADTGGVTRAGAGAALEMLIWRGCKLCSCGMTSIWMCQFEKDTTITVLRTGRWREAEVRSKRDWIWIWWSRCDWKKKKRERDAGFPAKDRDLRPELIFISECQVAPEKPPK